MKPFVAKFFLSAPLLVAVAAFLLSPLKESFADAPDEIRALWVQAWVADLHSPSGIDNLIADAKSTNINTLVVQMRRRGDTLYFSDIEPRISSGVPGFSSFDSLEYILEKAHAQNPPMEVHAWIVVYPVGSSGDPEHTSNKNPEWLTRNFDGVVDGQHDPGHPGVHQYLRDISMELVTKYDIDGLHYDYIRYNGRQWGYNPVAVERFQRLYNRADVPLPTDPEWSEFRRNQITQTVRRIYLYAIEARPEVKISASTITWSPGPADTSDFSSTRPYHDILSNWPAWMEEGILDLNIPMAYFRKHDATQERDYTRWNNFIKDTRFNRHAAIGPGIYLNTLANAVHQMRETREPSPSGNYADGVCGYVYHETNNQGLPFSEFRKAVMEPSVYDSVSPPMFAEPAAIPEMPWKTNPTTGHLKGYVRDAATQEPLDGAMVFVSGPVERTIQTDPTGFYGFVDLPPGDYLVGASWDGANIPATAVSIPVGEVVTENLLFSDLPPPTLGQLEGYVRNATTGEPIDGASVHLSSPAAGSVQTNAQGFYRFRNLPPGNYTVTATWTGSVENAPATMISTTAGEITHQDLHFAVAGPGGTPGQEVILDDLDGGVNFVGSNWVTGSFAGGYETNYRFAHNPSHPDYAGPHTATFSPTLPAAGFYQIDTWYSQGVNRPDDASYTISDGQSEEEILVNQQINGSQWFTVVEAIFIDPANGPFVTISNSGSSSVTMADAMRWSLLESVDPEYAITVQIEGLGRIEGIPEGGIVSHGANLQVEAIGEDGFSFSHWEGNAWGSENPLSLQVGADLNIRAVFESVWENWLAENFTEAERDDAELIAPEADPFGHGISNLLKFAFGLDPRQPDRTLLPAASAGDGVVLTFRRRQGDAALDYIVEYSDNLVVWDSGPERIEEISAEPNGDETETVTVHVSANEGERLFVRMLVEQK